MLCETAFVLCKSSPYHNNKFETLLAKSLILPKNSKVGLVKRLIKWKTNYQTYAFKYDHDKIYIYIYIYFYRKTRILLTVSNQKNAHQSMYKSMQRYQKGNEMERLTKKKKNTSLVFSTPKSERAHNKEFLRSGFDCSSLPKPLWFLYFQMVKNKYKRVTFHNFMRFFTPKSPLPTWECFFDRRRQHLLNFKQWE